MDDRSAEGTTLGPTHVCQYTAQLKLGQSLVVKHTSSFDADIDPGGDSYHVFLAYAPTALPVDLDDPGRDVPSNGLVLLDAALAPAQRLASSLLTYTAYSTVSVVRQAST